MRRVRKPLAEREAAEAAELAVEEGNLPAATPEVDTEVMSELWQSVTVISAEHGIPQKSQAVLTLRAFGWSPDRIAEALGYKDKSAVYAVIRRWDKAKDIARADDYRRLALVSMMQHVMLSLFETLAKHKKSGRLDEVEPEKVLNMLGQGATYIRNLGGTTRLAIDKLEGDLFSELERVEDGK